MQWSNIPHYIDYTSCHHINYGIVGLVEVVAEFAIDPQMPLQMEPDFQRGHVWTEKQQIAYMEYIFQGGQSGRDFYFNCPNWKGYGKVSEYNDFVCVDGLQRITAMRRFIGNEIKVFGCYYREYDRPLYRVEQTVSMYINSLQTKEEVLRWYIQMNNGGTPHSAQEIARVEQLLCDCVR